MLVLSSVFSEMTVNMLAFFSFTLGNSNSFPSPLTAEEEFQLFEKLKTGDEEARNILIERNLRLVAHITKKYGNINYDNDEIISIGTIGLIKAVSTFDNNKGNKFATYAGRCIENEILMTIRSDKKNQNQISLQESIAHDKDGNDVTLIDILKNNDRDLSEEIEIKMEIKKLYNKIKTVLKTREKFIIELRYGIKNGISKTQKEIASMLGISRSYVSRIEKSALEKLNQEMNK